MPGALVTELSLSSIASLGSTALANRLDDGMLAAVQALAAAPLPAPEPCDAQHFNQCLRVLLANLPKRNSDDISGKLLISTYQKKLGNLPKDQISFIADRAITECEWFPSIAECLRLAEGWERNDDAVRVRREATVAARWERQARFEEMMARLAAGDVDQSEIDGLPVSWLEVAETRGHLRREDGGRYTSRIPAKA
ncbi:hypothetical protein BES08_05785 [Novosphingobium resinovorum]|uniref:Uncharacterized protein n=2 Tax=Novosphingobium resinovorum TaxID=158500 RepID=A0A1D8A2H2_9SPHN|nr:hypothetical protein BES08_05785 [Novosphingobium resinovorum]